MGYIFIGENPKLEADFEESASGLCAVITHPHSLMGGDMSNNVVMAAWRTAVSLGHSALRFNFRGVGRSEGTFDHGNGEQEDLAQVVNFVDCPVLIVGYSFGAWIAAQYIRDVDVPCIFISPPTSMFTFPDLHGKNVWSVVGSEDQFCSMDALHKVLDKERITVIEGIDHFWFGGEAMLTTYLKKKIELVRSISY